MFNFSGEENISVYSFDLTLKTDYLKIPCYNAKSGGLNPELPLESVYINKHYFVGIIPSNIKMKIVLDKTPKKFIGVFDKILLKIQKQFNAKIFGIGDTIYIYGTAELSKTKTVENSYIFRGFEFEETDSKILENLYINRESNFQISKDRLLYELSWHYQEDKEGIEYEKNKKTDIVSLFDPPPVREVPTLKFI